MACLSFVAKCPSDCLPRLSSPTTAKDDFWGEWSETCPPPPHRYSLGLSGRCVAWTGRYACARWRARSGARRPGNRLRAHSSLNQARTRSTRRGRRGRRSIDWCRDARRDSRPVDGALGAARGRQTRSSRPVAPDPPSSPLAPADGFARPSLNEEIDAFLEWVRPTEEERKLRHDVFILFKRVVGTVFPRAKVELFGSMATGLYLPDG